MNELESNFKEICEIILLQTENNDYLINLNRILISIENSSNLQNKNLYPLWSFLQTKLNDYFKQLNKNLNETQQQQSKVNNYEAIYLLLIFPFKHFLNFKLEQVN